LPSARRARPTQGALAVTDHRRGRRAGACSSAGREAALWSSRLRRPARGALPGGLQGRSSPRARAPARPARVGRVRPAAGGTGAGAVIPVDNCSTLRAAPRRRARFPRGRAPQRTRAAARRPPRCCARARCLRAERGWRAERTPRCPPRCSQRARTPRCPPRRRPPPQAPPPAAPRRAEVGRRARGGPASGSDPAAAARGFAGRPASDVSG